MPLIDDAERRRRLVVRHRLSADQRVDDASVLADSLVAVHSSDPATVHLSFAIRMQSPSISTVEAALYEHRTLVRHHAMRRTMWVMTPTTARLAHAAATTKVAATERARTLKALAANDQVEDPEAWLAAATSQVHDLLAAEGELSTREVGRALPHLAIPIEFGSAKHTATLNAHTKVLQGAGFDGLLVRTKPDGSWTSAEYRWAATDAWLGTALADGAAEAAAAELLSHWLERFGPATELDIAWWFGWTKTLTRGALATAAAEPVELQSGDPAWVAAGDTESTPDPGPTVRLLPGLDATAMGWKERGWYIGPSLAPRIFDRFGNVGPTILVDGRIVGGWAQRLDGPIVLDLDVPLDTDHRRLLGEAVEELGDVLGDVVVKPRFPAPNQKALLA